MSDEQSGEVVKSGITWLEISTKRNKSGIEIFVKADPRIEEFFLSLADKGQPTANLEVAGRYWFSQDPLKPLSFYRVTKDPTGPEYRFDVMGGAFGQIREGERVNLSFLKLVGISKPEGVSFGVAGPFSRLFLADIRADLLTATRTFLYEYVVPVNTTLRISSQNL